MKGKYQINQLRQFLKPKYLLWLIVFILLALLTKKLLFPAAPTTNFITATVTRGDIEQTVLADGTVNAFKQVNVGAQVSGQIKKLYVKLGDQVKKGQLIAEIDDLTQQNSYKQAEASLDVLKAQRSAKKAMLQNYQLTYNRLAKLVPRGAVSRSELDAAKANLDSVKAEIKALDANIVNSQIAVSTAKLNLGYTKITSPIDGVIVAMPVEEGQTVNSVQTAPTIVKVAQLDKMTIEAQISEADVVKVKKGMPVYFTILGQPNKPYRGLVLRDIEPAPDSINSDSGSSLLSSSSSSNSAIYYNGLFDVDNPDHSLRVSMTAQVYIILAQKKNALLVPAMALQQQSGDEAIVQVMNGSSVEKRKVKVGINNNINAEILSNLKEGEVVMVGGAAGTAAKGNIRVRMGL